jgi:uncharacterized membrane protein YoaK (UPF0700 family)
MDEAIAVEDPEPGPATKPGLSDARVVRSDLARSSQRLPPLLSVIAGAVEVIAYITLGPLFTAHVTGNLVVIAALLAGGGSPNAAQALAVPVFIGALIAVWLIAEATGRRGPGLIRPLLVVQFLLLTIVLILNVIFDVAANPNGPIASIAAMVAVGAMADQFALLRLAIPGAPSTAVMTGNLTNAVLSLFDLFSRGRPLMVPDNDRLKRAAFLVIGFLGGCIVGALAVSWLGAWSWSIPVALAGVTAAVRWDPQ